VGSIGDNVQRSASKCCDCLHGNWHRIGNAAQRIAVQLPQAPHGYDFSFDSNRQKSRDLGAQRSAGTAGWAATISAVLVLDE
jgi:hypothetical protein